MGGTHHTRMHYCYRPQTKFAKVMFSKVSVCSQGGGSSVQGISVRETPSHRTVTCGRYASYWNAFLFTFIFLSFWTGDPCLTLVTFRFWLFATFTLSNCWVIKGSVSDVIDQFAHLSTGGLLFTCVYLCSLRDQRVLPPRLKGDYFPQYLHLLFVNSI